jgi:Phage integrase, N-terminal SAM-like domain
MGADRAGRAVLAFLTDVERSPNTVKAYAHDLKDWWVFLVGRGLDCREVRLEDIGEFVAMLRSVAGVGRVAVLPSVTAHCGEATVTPEVVRGHRILSARGAARGGSG